MREFILNFHGLGTAPACVDPGEHRVWLEEKAFNEILDAVRDAIDRLQMRILITFDDGNESDHSVALPALAARNLKAKFFVCAARVGRPHYLGKSAISDIYNAGMEIGSHGMRHVDWRGLSHSDLRSELIDARKKLEDISGHRICEVAVPFGSYGRREIVALREQDYECVYTSDGGYARAGAWLKPRNTVDRLWIGQFLTQVSGKIALWRQIKRSIAVGYKKLR
jgi:peptidoglycan/xylan/chitin deacetylase (PgdA/CDA1 family)